MLPTFLGDDRIILAAGADPRPEARARFAADFSARVYDRVEAMCEDPDLDAIYVATPHQYHRANVEAAARAGKHCLVEKPMALAIEDCEAMIEATAKAGVVMIVGHSHGFDAPIARTREIVASGVHGRLRMIQALQFTDFMYRPRRPEELDTVQGGGVIFNQAPHQVDIVRVIGGGRLRAVRAGTGVWDPARPTEGAYSAFLEFENGLFASIGYSGHGHFDTDELCGDISEIGMPKDSARYGQARAALAGVDVAAEIELKARRNYGGATYRPPSEGAAPGERWHEHFGLVLASCEGADLRPQPRGVWVYDNHQRRFEALEPPRVSRVEVIDELYGAVREGKTPIHGGEWSLATMETCYAILQSAREQREIRLSRQCALPAV